MDFHISKFKNTIDAREDFITQVARISQSCGKIQTSRSRTTLRVGKQMKSQNFNEEGLEKINQKKNKQGPLNLKVNIARAKGYVSEDAFKQPLMIDQKGVK